MHDTLSPARLATVRHRLLEAMALKALPRAGWVRVGVPAPEDVAAHSWGVAFLVLVLCPDGLDRGRALALATVHDLPEVHAGDLTPHDGVSKDAKAALERSALARLVEGLAPARALELVALWEEYEAGHTPEARFVKACDKLDMALMATRYAEAHGLDTTEFVDSALRKLDSPWLEALAGRV